jgi:hypothetical protein
MDEGDRAGEDGPICPHADPIWIAWGYDVREPGRAARFSPRGVVHDCAGARRLRHDLDEGQAAAERLGLVYVVGRDGWRLVDLVGWSLGAW